MRELECVDLAREPGVISGGLLHRFDAAGERDQPDLNIGWRVVDEGMCGSPCLAECFAAHRVAHVQGQDSNPIYPRGGSRSQAGAGVDGLTADGHPH